MFDKAFPESSQPGGLLWEQAQQTTPRAGILAGRLMGIGHGKGAAQAAHVRTDAIKAK